MDHILQILSPYFRPIIIFVSFIVVGFLIDRLFPSRLKKITKKSSWIGFDIVILPLKGKIFIWSMIIGAHIAIKNSTIPQETASVISKLLIVLLILAITNYSAGVGSGLLNLFSKKTEGEKPVTSIFVNLVKILIILIGVLTILRFLGISITPILTALGVGGLAVALALQETLSNLFAGIHIIATRPITIGNYVKLDSGEEGHVVDITWRNTTIKTIRDNIIVIPNSKIASANITNYSMPKKDMNIIIKVGVSYESDLPHVEKVTVEVARETINQIYGDLPAIENIETIEPFIRFNTFNDFSIDFSVIIRIHDFVDKYMVKHEFIKKLHQRYKQEGIEIPFPIRTVVMKNEKDG